MTSLTEKFNETPHHVRERLANRLGFYLRTYERGRSVIRASKRGGDFLPIPKSRWYDVKVDRYGHLWIEPIGLGTPQDVEIKKVAEYEDLLTGETYVTVVQCYTEAEEMRLLCTYYTVYCRDHALQDFKTHREAQEFVQTNIRQPFWDSGLRQ